VALNPELAERNRKKVSRYVASKRTNDEFLLSSLICKDGVDAGKPYFVQGNVTTLRHQLLKKIGIGNASLNRTVDPEHGEGWILITKIAIPHDPTIQVPINRLK
jgi:hypothetical protein